MEYAPVALKESNYPKTVKEENILSTANVVIFQKYISAENVASPYSC